MASDLPPGSPFAPQSAKPAAGKSTVPDLTTSAANQRTDKRAHAHFPYVLIMKNADGKDVKLSGYTDDISAGGVSVVSSASIPLQTMVAVRIEMACNGRYDNIVATGKCVHQAFSAKLGGFRYGVQFVKINDDYKKVIERYVKMMGF